MIGEEGVGADAEVIAVALDGLRDLGLDHDDVRARVSDRRLLTAVLSAIGVEDARLPTALAIIDKIERAPADRSLDRLQAEVGLDEAGARATFELLDQGGLDSVKGKFGDLEAVAAELERMEEYLGSLEAMGLGAFVEFDLRIVPGLGLLHRDRIRNLRPQGRVTGDLWWWAIRSFARVGPGVTPSRRWVSGWVMSWLGELLRDRDLAPALAPEVDYFIVIIGEEHRDLAYAIAHAQRDRGAEVQYALREQPVRKQFTAAGSAGAREVIVLGPDEVARECAVLRDMASGDEREVPLKELR